MDAIDLLEPAHVSGLSKRPVQRLLQATADDPPVHKDGVRLNGVDLVAVD
jgi:hypothetical protein